MLLLDHNVQKRLAVFLGSIGVQCKRASEMGWEEKRNGDLVAAAVERGFTAILTNDQDFVASAKLSLKKHPTFCIVILTLPQGRMPEYLPRFEQAWRSSPPPMKPGEIVHWP